MMNSLSYITVPQRSRSITAPSPRSSRLSFFAKRLGQFSALVALLFFATFNAYAGFSIQNGMLIDKNGNEFIMRGINYPHVWFPTQTATSIPNIAATGSNCVRIVLGSGQQWGPSTAADVAQVIELCKANRLIAVLEVHDCTGFGDAGNFAPHAAPVSTAVDYWLSIQNVLKGQEDFVIINIANEPLGNGVPAATWVSVHTDAITRLRAAGFTHTLMVDGATWGQDWDKTMLNNASTVFKADPLHNVIFSVHMYAVYTLRSTIQNYLTTFVTNQLPICVGEFGWAFQGQTVDSASIMEIAQTLGIGYMGWSWSGNGGSDAPLDLTINFNPNMLSNWGNSLINGVNGIAATSQLSSVFGNVPSLKVTPTVMTVPIAGSSATVNVTTNQSWAVTKNQTWITVAPASGTGDGSFTLTAGANTGIGPRSGVVTVTAAGLTRNITLTQLGTGGPGVCNNPVAATVPFTQNGVGEFCWVTSGDISFINSWNVQLLEINGVDFTNKWANSFPARINGNYYIHYVSNVGWAHFEANGSSTSTDVPATGVTVTPTSASVSVGNTASLSATVAPATATNKTVTWSSNNPSVATVNASGVVTGVAAGTATITATTQSGSFTASALITVTGVTTVPVTGVSVTPTSAGLAVGGTSPLTASVLPANATNKTVTWTSSNTAVATVSASGVVTGVAGGTATITATTQSGSFTASAAITVTASNVPTTGVTVSPATASVAVGATTALTATVAPATATNKTVTWTSSSSAVATVNASGVVTGVSVGSATITATTQSGSFTSSATVSVTSGTVTPCANPASSVLPLTRNGAGDFCFVTSGTVSFINSWNMQLVEINGVNFTNKWASTLPPKINGNYYIHYVGNFAWSHLEVVGTP